MVFKEDENYGICSFDSLEINDREADLRKIREKIDEGVDVFNIEHGHIHNETKLLGDRISIWRKVSSSLAISVSYEEKHLHKLMPEFVEKLDPPLIAVSDSKEYKNAIFFRESEVAPEDSKHFEHFWYFTD